MGSDCFVVMNDEKFLFLYGNDNFYSDDRAEFQNEVHYVGLEKFPTKILVSISISFLKGSELLLRQTNSLAINSMIFINEFLGPLLLLFTNEHTIFIQFIHEGSIRKLIIHSAVYLYLNKKKKIFFFSTTNRISGQIETNQINFKESQLIIIFYPFEIYPILN